MFNKAILIGRIGQDPEMRYTPSGTAVTNFSIATDRKWRDKAGALQEETTWHDIVCWGKQAEFVGEHCTKGRLVFVEGEIQKRSWDDKNGVKRISVEINAQVVRVLDRPQGGPQGGQQSGGSRPQRGQGFEPSPSYDLPPAETEDDVPF